MAPKHGAAGGGDAGAGGDVTEDGRARGGGETGRKLAAWGQERVVEGKEYLGWTFEAVGLNAEARLKFSRSKAGGTNRKSLAAYCKAVEIMYKFEEAEPQISHQPVACSALVASPHQPPPPDQQAANTPAGEVQPPVAEPQPLVPRNPRAKPSFWQQLVDWDKIRDFCWEIGRAHV